MGTRMQVKISQEGLTCSDGEGNRFHLLDEVMLYNHDHGAPEEALAKLAEAFYLSGGNYKAGRSGKVASFLCATDPGGFEPMSDMGLNPDLNFVYNLFLVNVNGGSMDDRPRWDVEVYRNTFEKEHIKDNLAVVEVRAPLETLAEKYCDPNNLWETYKRAKATRFIQHGFCVDWDPTTHWMKVYKKPNSINHAPGIEAQVRFDKKPNKYGINYDEDIGRVNILQIRELPYPYSEQESHREDLVIFNYDNFLKVDRIYELKHAEAAILKAKVLEVLN
ncbi:hypothetical protein COV18_04110 [Candidatus Woesearchaeota archaeon CG10_big_fil_rev_8_21_14_0_10_37_12]|nr:MAG: hypothetical protein COV18_04110 [Candidatus Woesearchaeota archaeon CG10_big_fil_rev_8_21_14_0_10_37_12]